MASERAPHHPPHISRIPNRYGPQILTANPTQLLDQWQSQISSAIAPYISEHNANPAFESSRESANVPVRRPLYPQLRAGVGAFA